MLRTFVGWSYRGPRKYSAVRKHHDHQPFTQTSDKPALTCNNECIYQGGYFSVHDLNVSVADYRRRISERLCRSSAPTSRYLKTETRAPNLPTTITRHVDTTLLLNVLLDASLSGVWTGPRSSSAPRCLHKWGVDGA